LDRRFDDTDQLPSRVTGGRKRGVDPLGEACGIGIIMGANDNPGMSTVRLPMQADEPENRNRTTDYGK
jgi:hypothetical protein